MLPWLSALLILLASSLYFPFHSNIHVLLDDTRSKSLESNASRILLLTAHPDDECYFFAPTVLALRQHSARPEIYSLTLSIGNADGLGVFRKDELTRSLDVMGIDQDKRWVVDHPMLQDNITLEWDPSVIAVVAAPYVVSNHIDTILTFDTKGISSHPNHCALPFGAGHLANTLQSHAPRVFSLVTVPIFPKYAGAFALLSSRIRVASQMILSIPVKNGRDRRTIFTSGFKEYVTTVQAMRKHASQLVWFRYLYATFSSYMWVNEWVEIEPAGTFQSSA